jgi:hypothetical protein
MAQSKVPLTFVTESLPEFSVGVAQQVALQVSGGAPPYRFGITSGALPNALALSQSGMITGAVASEVPDSTVFVEVTDSAGSHLTQAFDVQVSGS